MLKPDPNSLRSIARKCGLSVSHVVRCASGERKPGDTPAGRRLARLLASRRPVAAGN